MKSFDEVLKKHFGERFVRVDNLRQYSIFFVFDEKSVTLKISYSGYQYAPLQTFQSPEKLDIFLTLLFEVN
jgi:hypothetical protein